ncbi:phosphoheptose isomerase [Lachnospiraceae bacterium oral taxon 096]|jgi:sedoheptulose 7-phosphate isomerase|nr:SIS domain-containing protein [Lachnospiraceae bacterium]PTL27700.1 phosphoheptose isomerase [Lachnospiraceae bacterium oral taxon 096]QUI96576.1 SIS domain-containing protein [Lachnospiraceae bacterium oral taxon 096]RKW33743.1 MAG: SIS domain-containing protein [Lachnoanaerobaculum sp.]
MDYIAQLIERYPVLASVENEIRTAYQVLERAYTNHKKLLVGGNGGSCADAEHIVGELMKGFVKKREIPKTMQERLLGLDQELGKQLANGLQSSLRAIAITGHAGLSTAFANDVDPEMTYAQQVNGYGDEGDVLLAISTSGNSKNLIYAALTARAKDMPVVLLSGKDGGKLRAIADVSIVVPNQKTYQIQELHLPIYHALCLQLEDKFFK